ncbi:MAG: hypothetical protein AB7O96_19225, partial [Pseudobdellovibrionaceae bacterium]
MSSVGSSDRRSDDIIRRNREEYQSREAEQTKKQKKQVKNLTTQHNKEIEQLKSEHAEQMESLRGRARESLSEKDKEYQEQIQDVRKMYQEQMSRKSAESENQLQRNSEEAKQAIAKERAINEGQKERLLRNHQEDAEKTSKTFQEALELSRIQSKDSVEKRRDILQKAHQKEILSLVNDRDERVMNLQRSVDDVRQAKNSEIGDLKRKSASDKNRMSEAMKAAVLQERAGTGQALETKDKLLQAERQITQKKFDQKLKQINDQTHEIREQLKEDVDGRINSQVRSGQSENAELRAKLVNERLASNATQKVEKQHIIQAYEERLNEVDSRAKEGSKQLNIQSRRNIEDVNQKNQKLLTNINQFHESNLEISNAKHQGDRMQLNREHRNAQSSLQKSTD